MSNYDLTRFHGAQIFADDNNWTDTYAEDSAVTGWTIGNPFVLCVCFSSEPGCNKNTNAQTLTLSFRKDGGDWTTLGASSEISYASTSASLTNGDPPSAQRITTDTPIDCGTGYASTGKEIVNTNVSASITLTSETWSEVHFALDTDNASAGSTYEFRLTSSLTGDLSDGTDVVINTSIKMASAPFNITPDSTTHSHTAGTASVSSSVTWTPDPDNATHSHSAGVANTTVGWDTNPANASHTHTAGTASMTVEWDIDPNNASHTHTATSPAVGESTINDFSNDESCVAMYDYESGNFMTDSSPAGANDLTDAGSGFSEDSTNHIHRGSQSAYGDGSATAYASRTDTNLSNDFPLKSGGGTAITICTWFSNNGGSSRYIISKGNASTGVYIYYNSSEGIGFRIDGTYIWRSNEDPAVEDRFTAGSEDFHISFGVDSSGNWSVRIWDDTNKKLVTGSGSGTTASANSVDFGVGGLGTSCILGNLDETVIFNRKISNAEMDEIRNGTFNTVRASITPDSCSHSHAADSANVTVSSEPIAISPDSATHSHSAGTAGTTVAWAITPNSASHSHTANTASATVGWSITPNTTTHSHTAQSAAVDSNYAIAPANASHSHTASPVGVSVGWSIAPNNATHSHTATEAGTSVSKNVTPDSVSHSHTATSASTDVGWAVNPDSASHSHTVTTAAMTVERDINPDSATHSHTVTSSQVSSAVFIYPQSATHSHTATSAATDIGWSITPDSASHTHTATSASTNVGWDIAPDSATHSHSATSAATDTGYNITPSDSSHAHSATEANVTVQTAAINISPSNTSHAQSATSPEMSLILDVSPDNSLHSHAASEARVVDSSSLAYNTVLNVITNC